jgi:enamine deaminase RidA (YjgF/YER057c/UK114 family)
MSIHRHHVGARLSDMVVFNQTVYLAGQIADDPTRGVADQTRQVLANIDRLLAEAGTDKTRVLSCTIFLADMADFPAMNEAWDAWVPAGHCPARATVEAKLFKPEYRVEIQAVAAL